MMEKMWSGRFSEASAELLERFNASLPFDKALYREDIEGSKAHAKMLYKQKILTKVEYEEIAQGLDCVLGEIERGEFEFKIACEDIHMAIESRLTELIGESGKKLHTARSRNDQVALDFRMFTQRHNREIRASLMELMDTLLKIASKHTKTLMPGMTHLQHAQPVNFGFHLVAYACMFKRDVERLADSYALHDYCPLGVAALAGTPYANDREFLARKLGFQAPTLNAMDTVSDRDFALDLLYGIALIMMHVSRLSEELVLWSSYEFGFISLSDSYSTGSSIMPQKKNPDVPELLRGKSGRVYGNLLSLLTVMKGLPLAYNKDTQEDKESVLDSIETVQISLKILKEALESMSVNTKRMREACRVGHLSATDLADFLVRTCGVPFREAHHIAGRIVAYAESKRKDITELKEEEILALDPRIKAGVLEALNLKNSMNARNSQGGTSSEQTGLQIKTLRAWLKKRKK